MVYWNEKLTRIYPVLRNWRFDISVYQLNSRDTSNIQMNEKYISEDFISNYDTNLHMIHIDAIMR